MVPASLRYAKFIGAEVYATAGAEEKHEFLRKMGVLWQSIRQERSTRYSNFHNGDKTRLTRARPTAPRRTAKACTGIGESSAYKILLHTHNVLRLRVVLYMNCAHIMSHRMSNPASWESTCSFPGSWQNSAEYR